MCLKIGFKCNILTYERYLDFDQIFLDYDQIFLDFDSQVVYVGVMSPEENMIVILQAQYRTVQYSTV